MNYCEPFHYFLYQILKVYAPKRKLCCRPISVRFQCVRKLGLALCPCLSLWFAADFGLKYRKRFESCLFLSGHLKINAITPCQFWLVIRFFLSIHYHHRRLGAASWKGIGEEGIAQHRQAHPDTALSTAYPRESPIEGVYICVCVRERGCLPKGAHFVSIVEHIWERGVSFMQLIREPCIVYVACILGRGVSPLWSSLGSHVLCILRACNEPTSNPQIQHKP